jgi:hypothetical protein
MLTRPLIWLAIELNTTRAQMLDRDAADGQRRSQLAPRQFPKKSHDYLAFWLRAR